MSTINTKLGIVGLGKETTYGTEVEPTIYLPVLSENFTSSNEVEIKDIIAGNVEYKLSWTGNFNAGGDMSMPAYYDLLGYLLYAHFGSVTTSTPSGATNTRKHVFSFSNTLPSFTLFVNRVAQKFNYVGGVLNRLSMSYQSTTAPIEITAGWFFSKEKKTTFSPNNAIPTTPCFARTGTTIKINDSANAHVSSITFQSDRGIKMDSSRTLNSGRFATEPASGTPKITGNITVLFRDMTEWEYFWGSASSSSPEETELQKIKLEITTTGSLIETGFNNKLVITLPSIHLLNRTDGTLNRPGEDISVSFSYEAIYDTTAGYMAQVELYNTQTSY